SPHSPIPPLFPYTTLFRSSTPDIYGSVSQCTATFLVSYLTRKLWWAQMSLALAHMNHTSAVLFQTPLSVCPFSNYATACSMAERSEEHTSELQSRENLVCR